MLGKPSDNVVLLDQGSEKVDAGQNSLSILEASDDCIIVVRIEIVALFVADMCKVVSELFGREIAIIFIQLGIFGDSPQSAADFLEISVFAT